jgi:hypothetical protein
MDTITYSRQRIPAMLQSLLLSIALSLGPISPAQASCCGERRVPENAVYFACTAIMLGVALFLIGMRIPDPTPSHDTRPMATGFIASGASAFGLGTSFLVFLLCYSGRVVRPTTLPLEPQIAATEPTAPHMIAGIPVVSSSTNSDHSNISPFESVVPASAATTPMAIPKE